MQRASKVREAYPSGQGLHLKVPKARHRTSMHDNYEIILLYVALICGIVCGIDAGIVCGIDAAIQNRIEAQNNLFLPAQSCCASASCSSCVASAATARGSASSFAAAASAIALV